MPPKKSEERNAVHDYFKALKTMWWMLPPMLASVFAWQLEAALHIPVFVTYAIGYGIMAAVIFRHARGVWAKAAKEKCEMQKRFEAEDAALFGAPKNNRM